MKLTTVEANGLYHVLNEWDPVLFLDGHLMDRVTHGYANTYGTVTVPASAPGPRDYVHDKLFPAVRDKVRNEFGLEVFTHALLDRKWPPTVWSHDLAAWTVEAKFVVNDYGLRNRMAIITETPGQPTFEQRVYAQYAYFMALLEYTNAHAAEMRDVVKKADEETVARVKEQAESGTLKNFLDGEYHSRGKINVSRVQTGRCGVSAGNERAGNEARHGERQAGNGGSRRSDGCRSGRARRSVPRGYLFPATHAGLAAKLRAHNITVTTLDKPTKFDGDAFTISGIHNARSRGYDMKTLDGTFARAAGARISGGNVRRRHGAADGQRGVLLSRAAGARRLRRVGRDRPHGFTVPASIQSSSTCARCSEMNRVSCASPRALRSASRPIASAQTSPISDALSAMPFRNIGPFRPSAWVTSIAVPDAPRA